jgi:formylmethanofuran dehydrogenase subunit E
MRIMFVIVPYGLSATPGITLGYRQTLASLVRLDIDRSRQNRSDHKGLDFWSEVNYQGLSGLYGVAKWPMTYNNSPRSKNQVPYGLSATPGITLGYRQTLASLVRLFVINRVSTSQGTSTAVLPRPVNIQSN